MQAQERADSPIRLLTIAEFAAALRVSRRTAQALLSGGRVPSLRVGPRGVRVLESDLEAFVRDARERAAR